MREVELQVKSAKFPRQYIGCRLSSCDQRFKFEYIFCFNKKSSAGWSHWFDSDSYHYSGARQSMIKNLNTGVQIYERFQR